MAVIVTSIAEPTLYMYVQPPQTPERVTWLVDGHRYLQRYLQLPGALDP